MIAMPSNFAIQASRELNLALLQELPNKVNEIVIDIMSGKRKVLKVKTQDKFLSVLGQGEHLGARVFGACIQVSNTCNQCGLCVRNCPQNNIRMDYGKPKFGFRCMFCLKCIYACPTKALSPGILKFTVLKNGFHLEKMVQQSKQATNYNHIIPKHSVAWQGVIDYLSK
jgi:ferredoxin